MTSHKICDLNDRHRKNIPGTKTIITRGIDRLGPDIISEVIEKVRSFDNFNSDNDPYGERDYGSFEHAGEKLFWKVDYHNRELNSGSEDASDPEKTCRILTIAKVSEY